MSCKSPSAFPCPLSIHLKRKRNIKKDYISNVTWNFLLTPIGINVFQMISFAYAIISRWLHLNRRLSAWDASHFLSGFKVVTQLPSTNESCIFLMPQCPGSSPCLPTPPPRKSRHLGVWRHTRRPWVAITELNALTYHSPPILLGAAQLPYFVGASSAFCNSLLALSWKFQFSLRGISIYLSWSII